MSKTNYQIPEEELSLSDIPAEITEEYARSVNKEPKARRRGRFWIGLGIYAAVFALVIAAGLVVFWNFIKAYELSRPDTTMLSFIESTDEDYWLDLIKTSAQTPFSEFEDQEQLTETLLLSKIRGQDITYSKYTGVFTDDSPVYIISAGDTQFCRASLIPEEKSSVGFGFTTWQLGKTELLESFDQPYSRTIQLTVKEDAEIILNGKAVSEEYALPDNDNYISVYRIENIYEDYTLDVCSSDGTAETPVSVSGDDYLYPVPDKLQFTFNINVPDDATVTVGDVTLTSEQLTGAGMLYPVWEDLQELTNLDSLSADFTARLSELLKEQPTFSQYSYSVLDYERPAVTAVSAEGVQLSHITLDEGRYIFSAQSNGEDQEVADRAEKFIRRYISFSTNAGNSPQTNLHAIVPYMLRDTKLYDRIVASTDGMQWVNGRVVTYNSLEVSDVSVYDGILATCRVFFSVNNITNHGSRLMEDTYDLALVNTDGVWRVVSMVAVESY